MSPPELRFTERMSGYVWAPVGAPDAPDAFAAAYEAGRTSGASIQLDTAITHPDLPALLDDPSSPAVLTGTVRAPSLSPSALDVVEGGFVLLEPNPAAVEQDRMRYRMVLRSRFDPQETFFLEGHKVIEVGSILAAWPDTTTLFVTIHEGDTADGPVRALGIMHIGLFDVTHLLANARVHNAGPVEGEILLLRFGAMFLRSIWPFYGGMLNELGRFPAPPATAEASDALDVVSAPDRVAPAQGVAALDSTMRPSDPDLVLVCDRSGRWHPHRDVPDACSRLIRFEGGGKGPVMLASGFAMSATSFLAPTVRPNLTEALLEAGYDVWLFDYRAGIDLPSAATQFTVDDIARTDWPQAVGQVLDVTGARTVQVFAHCVGSVSLLMALLDPGNGMQGRVRSAVCAQFTLHPMTSRLKVFESKHHLGALLEAAGQKVLRPDTERTVRNIALDIALSAVPHPHHEGCELPVCRWINAVFGMTHRHAQLDDATHRALPGMFGDANIHCLTHLGLMMQRARAVDAQGRDRYLQHPELLRGVPIHILAGEDNYIFHPEGNERTLRWLQEHNDPDDYTLTMLPGYAHLDALVGRDAPRQVFPDIIEHLDRHR